MTALKVITNFAGGVIAGVIIRKIATASLARSTAFHLGLSQVDTKQQTK